MLRSINRIERTFKALRRRFQGGEVFPSVQALECRFCCHLARRNARWGARAVRGFQATRHDLKRLFDQRYSSSTQNP